MSYLIGILQTVLPVLLVLGIGSVCRQKNIFSREGIDALKSAAVNIALPAVLLKAFATASYSPKQIFIPVFIYLICLLGWFLGKLACRFLGFQDRYLPYLTTGFEVGMLGYTFFSMLYQDSIAALALFDLGQVLFVFTIYRILVDREFSDGKEKTSILKMLLTSPIILAILAGVLIGATGFYGWMEKVGISTIFDSSVSFIAAPTSVLILLSIGYDLVLKDVPWAKVIRVVIARAIIMTAAAFASYFLLRDVLDDRQAVLHAVCVMFILPPPYALPIFSKDDSQSAYLSSALTVFTIVSIICFAVLACIV